MADALPSPSIPEIIQRYVNGEPVATLAADSRVSRRLIYKWIHTVGDQQAYDLVTEALICRLADADESLSQASDSVQIARAREEAKFARFDLERRRAKTWGPKQEIEVDNKITVVINRLGPVSVESLESVPDRRESETSASEREDASTGGDVKAGGGIE